MIGPSRSIGALKRTFFEEEESAKSGLITEVGNRTEQRDLDLLTVMRCYKLATYKRGVEEERAQTEISVQKWWLLPSQGFGVTQSAGRKDV